MPNAYFQFKHFAIHQDRCAMKIGTDGVLLGAWTDVQKAKRVLDIGTGTGLLALMLAQRSDAYIDAIEIEEEAAHQAAENVKASLWSDRIRVYNISLQQFEVPDHLYDLIITNPPYFQHHLKAPGRQRTLARHNKELTFTELINAVGRMLSVQGQLSIVLPSEVFEEFCLLAKGIRLLPGKVTRVLATPGKPSKRTMAMFSFEAKQQETTELVIEKYGRHKFSEEYTELTKEFYLHMN
jgi:tRNA1Val (adenine37-N6)-methyltransferase